MSHHKITIESESIVFVPPENDRLAVLSIARPNSVLTTEAESVLVFQNAAVAKEYVDGIMGAGWFDANFPQQVPDATGPREV